MRWRKAGVYYRQCYLCRWRKQQCKWRLIRIILNRNSDFYTGSGRFIGFSKKIGNVYRRSFEVELIENSKAVFRNLHSHALMFYYLLFFKEPGFSPANTIIFDNADKSTRFFLYVNVNYSSFSFMDQPVPDGVLNKRL